MKILRKLKKWNYETHKYDNYVIPYEWNVKTYSENLNELVNCPHCGKQVVFGSTYTSLEIHTPIAGFGYAVCFECYEKEWEQRKKYKND